MSGEMASGAALKGLKAKAQLLPAQLRVGKAGVSPEFLALLKEALHRRGLIKIRLEGANKESKKSLVPEIARATGSQVILQVGNVATFYLASGGAESRKSVSSDS